ncbi:unnamed protein product [Clonostachys rosea f. rosea IK726]|uniref:Uncharacterized protein n=4 Tax=Bionectria ochroleuca TaxID=29856 RepID=A0A0B7KH66_BIOOC|nr:unnamed protein product [Clonostachys rosea f. rosea IK726]CAG9950776.1 unnamed protein product [Clonostachys rosea f. rosea IK726]CAG9950783.1 unnamed protein product [Clonostachys rosea f. rosea IK726]
MHFIKTFISIFALQTIAIAQLEGQDLVTRNEYQIARGKYLAARDEFLTTRELYLRQGATGKCDRVKGELLCVPSEPAKKTWWKRQRKTPCQWRMKPGDLCYL